MKKQMAGAGPENMGKSNILYGKIFRLIFVSCCLLTMLVGFIYIYIFIAREPRYLLAMLIPIIYISSFIFLGAGVDIKDNIITIKKLFGTRVYRPDDLTIYPRADYLMIVSRKREVLFKYAWFLIFTRKDIEKAEYIMSLKGGA